VPLRNYQQRRLYIRKFRHVVAGTLGTLWVTPLRIIKKGYRSEVRLWHTEYAYYIKEP